MKILKQVDVVILTIRLQVFIAIFSADRLRSMIFKKVNVTRVFCICFQAGNLISCLHATYYVPALLPYVIVDTLVSSSRHNVFYDMNVLAKLSLTRSNINRLIKLKYPFLVLT